jgi:predicted kinase
VSDSVYQHMAGLARAVLAGGRHVIIDAAFLRRSSRQLFISLAVEFGLVPVAVACEAPLATLRERIERRSARGDDPSEATLEVLEWQGREAEQIAADEGLRTIVAHTDGQALHEVLLALADLALPRGDRA